jgi:cell surface protein SprA
MRREGKLAEPERSPVAIDTVGALAAIKLLPRDSSARLAVFHRVRRDLPTVPLEIRRLHPLYLDAGSLARPTHVFDGNQLRYRLEWKLAGKDARIPVEMTFDEYREYRKRLTERKNWEALAQAYRLEGEKKRGLGELFGEVTNIEIPVPKNPLFSIFGPNIIKLQINGAVDIHAAFRNTRSDSYVASPLGQVRNEPDFNQEVQVNVKGEIGDKLTINADWNTQRTFEYENQLRVKYTGYEDEIIQSVEAGNVSLQTNSGFVSSNQALFGIKSVMQFGPLRLTTLASQKKGQIKDLTISGGARSTPFERKPHEYSRDHYFVDIAYRNRYELANVTIPLSVDSNLVIQDMEVWVTRIGTDDPNERDVVAFISSDSVRRYQNDLAARRSEFSVQQGEVEVGRFVRLDEGKDYTYHQYLGYISLNRTLQPEQAIAVAFTLPTGDIGTFSARDTVRDGKLILKLVRPRRLDPHMKHAWSLLLKNIYSLGGRNISKEKFTFDIFYQLPGKPPPGEKTVFGVNILEMVGLDRYNNIPTRVPDTYFDYLPPYTINEARGEVIFPVLEPFGRSIYTYFAGVLGDTLRARQYTDSIAVYAVYDTTYNGAANHPKNVFVMRGEITAAIASTYNLGFNVVEGSVQVIANGNPALPNVDYTVDYITGQVTIKNQSFLVPGTDLQIRYEQNDLFQLASKSLLGARGELSLGKDAGLGFTIMNLNQQTLSDKVRLGEEPISNTIVGIDAGMNVDVPVLTRVVNYLPGIQTSAASSFSLRSEAAYMMPDPNTRKSTIPQDQSKGIAYIDDFEGARRIIPLGHNYQQWAFASVPFYIPTIDPYVATNKQIPTANVNPAQILPDTLKMEYRALAAWFNVLPSDVLVKDIWPNRSVSTDQQQVTVMDVYFDPGKRGPYNYSLDLTTKLFSHPERAWSGAMRPLGTTATNLLDENINFIELWIFFERTQPTARLYIDLGVISEDVIPNRRLDSEDGLKSGIRNGTLNQGEDVGLDGLTDDEEQARFASFITRYPDYAHDPSGDNWNRAPFGSLDPLDYLSFNNPEGNSEIDVGKIPDTEDLNRNNNLDRLNNYFEYEIALDPNSDDFKKWVTGGNPKSGWYQIRIPINEYVRRIGDPSFTTIESVRWWITGAHDVVHFRLTEFNLIGNQWEEQIKNDTTLRVTVVNIEDNPLYTSPPGVRRERNRARPDQELFGNEQSLALVIKDLKDGDSRQVIKRYQSRPLDIVSYRTMKMFVHGDDRPGTRFRYIDSTKYDAELFLRFGSDTLNFYEYRAPIRPGWDPANEVVINFKDLTAIKLGRDSANAASQPVPVPDGPEGATYRVRGQPTLTLIRFIAIGIHNPRQVWEADRPLSGEVWVNELRLTDVDDTPGWAYRVESSLKIADVVTMNFNLTQQDPFFHKLEDRFGTRSSERRWGFSSGIMFEKFLPRSWGGTTLSFNFTHLESVQKPRYLPGTDILVEEAAERITSLAQQRGSSAEEASRSAEAIRLASQTLAVSETYSLPMIKFNVPSDFWLVRETINRMTFGFTYNTTRSRNPTAEVLSDWGWNARFGYGLQFGQENYLQPLSFVESVPGLGALKGWKFYYAPRTLTVGTTMNRRQTREQLRNQPPRPIVRSLTATRQLAFGWPLTEGGLLNLSTDYSLDIQSNLVHLEVDRFGRQRSFGEILGHIIGGEKFIDFGVDQNYGQSISVTSRPKVPGLWKLDRMVSPSARYNVQYSWTNNVQAGALGKASQWNSNLSLSLDVSVKMMGDEIWGKPPAPNDTAQGRVARQVDQLTRVLFKSTLFDFDRLSITLTQSNRSQNSGLLGRPGFVNLFGRIPFVQESLPEYGPSFLYQLGLSSDPHGRVVMKSKRQFPFITGTTVAGPRAPLGNLADIYSQTNRVTMRTSRPLWEGAQIELNWNVGWSYNLNRTIVTDSMGVPSERSRVVSGDIEQSFLTFPSVFVFKFFKTSVEEVNKKYEALKINRRDTRPDDAKLSQAFEEGMEAVPLTRRVFGKLFPHLNWTLRWDGLEKFDLFSSFAQRVGLDHAYSSSYRRRTKVSPSGQQLTESQQISYTFAPLVGLNVTFKELLKGNFGASFRYNVTTSFDLVPANQNITETNANDMSITASYSRRGFEIPFFGLSLSNDVDMNFTYSYSKNVRRLYTLKENFKPEGTPQEGSSRKIIEPRIRYILSSRVTASLYYKYTRVKPDEGGSKIPGSTINEGGLDIRVAIQ